MEVFFQLFFFHQSVDGQIQALPVKMGIMQRFHQIIPGEIVCICPGAEPLSTHIYRIRSGLDGGGKMRKRTCRS